ncbi:Aste57867_10177 [Aphanomyces stellatus]|uniref:Aste57867_10177 protein n=1 Tax=Aphanomyces stellatus TaxID=120398 RepID=A0A485KPQ8_9STRA|nr:hypothetical protein As57867_010138 [Aphanomyces stellatus]VFT87053.1 Aste57867_10177 [Aphanomyces stellatus]
MCRVQQKTKTSLAVGPTVPLPYELLHHGFETHAKLHPSRRAVEYEDTWLSYGELDARANTLASELTALGVRVGSRVAVVMERCLEFPIGLLAVLKAGGVMMPLDATFPPARLQYILSDGNAVAVVSTNAHREHLANLDLEISFVCVDATALAANPAPFAQPCKATRNDEAYIVYTSGSTGKPKGVSVLHRGVVNATSIGVSDVGIVEGTRVMQFMAIGFDVCQWEIWSTLSAGATLVFRTADAFQSLQKVDVVMCTATALALFGHPITYPQLKSVLVGGEAIAAALKDLWSPFVSLFNCYGPSECAITTHIQKLTPDAHVAIGKPLHNVASYVLDDSQRPVPVGVVGEMYLGGICVSPAYINLPDQTAERFLADPFVGGDGRMFRTGDLGRLHPNGTFEILGRQDSQVKLKGYRIELDEVAQAMMEHPDVLAAAVLVKDKTHLVGYFSPSTVSVDALRETVSAHLPVYMTPAVWVGVDDMPQNVNGKIDKKALEALDVVLEVSDLETETERQMAAVWARVLQVDVREIGRNTSFFALGGDSISVVQVVAACRAMGLHLTSSALLTGSVLSKVAQSVVEVDDSFTWPQVNVAENVKEAIASEWSEKLLLTVDISIYPVTPLQAGMVFATAKDPSAYVEQEIIAIPSFDDGEKLKLAFSTVVARRDILRTTFVTTTNGTFQVVRRPDDAFHVPTVSASPVDAFAMADRERGFEIGDSYFVRFTIVHTNDDNRSFAVLTIHHALCDGWTISMLVDDLFDAVQGHALSERASFTRVVDFIEAQDKGVEEAYWRNYLAGVAPNPMIRSFPNNMSHPPAAENQTAAKMSSVSLADLSAAAKDAGVTVADVAKLAWAATLRKFTRQDDVVFGQVLANRDIPVPDADRILGPLLSTVPCRVRFDDAKLLASMLVELHADRSAMLSFTYASLLDIKKWGDVHGDLFDSLFVFQNLPPVSPVNGFRVLPATAPSIRTTEYAVEVLVEPSEVNLKTVVKYNPQLISSSVARLIVDEFDFTLSLLCTNLATQALASKCWELSPSQTQAIEAAAFGPDAALPFELLHHAYEARVKLHPKLVAVEYEGARLSYSELCGQANTVASRLAELGVRTRSRVAVVMERCLEFPVGLLATLQVGAAAVPLDATFPPSRLRFILSDANVVAVVTTSAFIDDMDKLGLNIPVVCADATTVAATSFLPLAVHAASRTDEAYVVYTSGSTGKPKGVPVLHQSAVNAVMYSGREVGIVEGARVLQFMAIGFDGFQADMWKSLAHGATLVLRGKDNLDALQTVDVVACTPTALSLLGDPTQYPRLKVVAVAGEACPPSLKDLWLPHVRFMNLYGPSECAIMTHFAELQHGAPTSIGKSFENVNCYILDYSQRPVPVGVVGEMYLGGICVSPAYINLPDQTAERFLADPFVGGDGRMFRTGDLGRLHPNGTFEILGRQDSQVKLKGYRIELDEVAQAMMEHPDVLAAAVLVKDKTHLVGYFSPSTVSVDALRETVSAHLPVYMTPAVWVGVDDMPHNVNGKIDKKALEALDVVLEVSDLETETERQMAAVWARVLQVDVREIGRNTSFFALGGDSISVVKVVTACKKVGLSIKVAQLVRAVQLSRAAAMAKKM